MSVETAKIDALSKIHHASEKRRSRSDWQSAKFVGDGRQNRKFSERRRQALTPNQNGAPVGSASSKGQQPFEGGQEISRSYYCRSRFVRTIVLIATTIVVTLSTVVLGVNWAGVCYARKRIPSNEEILVDALRFVSLREDFPVLLQRDQEIREFIHTHPDCCEISWTSERVGNWALKRLFGMAQVEVIVRH